LRRPPVLFIIYLIIREIRGTALGPGLCQV
jgi:hypothetical protein